MISTCKNVYYTSILIKNNRCSLDVTANHLFNIVIIPFENELTLSFDKTHPIGFHKVLIQLHSL